MSLFQAFAITYITLDETKSDFPVSCIARLGSSLWFAVVCRLVDIRRKNQESALSQLFSLTFSEENGLSLLHTEDKGKGRAGFLSKISFKANVPIFCYSWEIHNVKYKQETP